MGSYWIETLGCAKNQVDSDKLAGRFAADGLVRATGPQRADVVVVNTCAFIEAARAESIESVLTLDDRRKSDSRLVVTGCMAQRYGEELAAAFPEVDQVAGFGVPVQLTAKPAGAGVDVAKFDLLNLPRPSSSSPWAYVKIAEGCDRTCGFCAIPSFRGKQNSRTVESILEEVDALHAREIVLVAQDLASFGRERKQAGSIVGLIRAVAERVERVRCLYLYPSDLSDDLIEAIGSSTVAYFDLSLQHVSKPLLRRMRRWGDGDRFLRRIDDIRDRYPHAAFRSNFIVGYPGETEADHDQLLAFLEAAQLDWCGFFTFSNEEGTYAAGLGDQVPAGLMDERLRECNEIQDRATMARRTALIGTDIDVLVDEPGVARSFREAPEIDGIVEVPTRLAVGDFHTVRVTGVQGPDLAAQSILSLASEGGAA